MRRRISSGRREKKDELPCSEKAVCWRRGLISSTRSGDGGEDSETGPSRPKWRNARPQVRRASSIFRHEMECLELEVEQLSLGWRLCFDGAPCRCLGELTTTLKICFFLPCTIDVSCLWEQEMSNFWSTYKVGGSI